MSFNLLNIKCDLVPLLCNIPFVFTFSYFVTIKLCCTFVLHISCVFLATCFCFDFIVLCFDLNLNLSFYHSFS
jgi:hypothetical protein